MKIYTITSDLVLKGLRLDYGHTTFRLRHRDVQTAQGKQLLLQRKPNQQREPKQESRPSKKAETPNAQRQNAKDKGNNKRNGTGPRTEGLPRRHRPHRRRCHPPRPTSCSRRPTRGRRPAACFTRILAAAERTGTGAETYLGAVGVLEARNLPTKGPNLPQDGPLYTLSAEPDRRANGLTS